MDVFKSLEKVEAGINEAKERFMDGLINYKECLRAMASVICKEYDGNDDFDEIEIEEDKDSKIGNIDADWRNE